MEIASRAQELRLAARLQEIDAGEVYSATFPTLERWAEKRELELDEAAAKLVDEVNKKALYNETLHRVAGQTMAQFERLLYYLEARSQDAARGVDNDFFSEIVRANSS